MKRILLVLVAFTIAGFSPAQLALTDVGGGQDYNGGYYVVDSGVTDLDVEHPFWVTNTSSQGYNVGARRIELDVTVGVGMQSTICWVICPNFVPLGQMPIRTSDFSASMDPGQIDSSFVMHLRPNNYDGCTSYRIEWFDADNTDDVLASVDLIFDHSAGSCPVGLEDILLNGLDITLSPNPADEIVLLDLEGLEHNIDVQVSDLLGQVVRKTKFYPTEGSRISIPTAQLTNGIYFVSLLSSDQVLRTMKLVVKH